MRQFGEIVGIKLDQVGLYEISNLVNVCVKLFVCEVVFGVQVEVALGIASGLGAGAIKGGVKKQL